MALFCPTCQRRAPAGSARCVYDDTPLQPDPRVGMKLGALQLAEFSEQVQLGPVYRLRGSDEAMLVFEGEAIDPHADFELFINEVERLNEIDAPQIHRVSAVGEAAGLQFCIQRAPDGIPLSWVLDEAEGQIALGTVIFILHEIAAGLAEAHAHGVVHGGLSPDCVRLIGGIEAYSIIVDSFVTVRLRAAGDLPHPVWDYAAPDADHRAPTAADDLFALGAIAFELLAGQHPFRQHQRSRYQVPPFAQVVDGMPEAVCELVDRLLSLKPGHRPPAAAVQQTLDSLDLPLLLLSHVPDPATTDRRLAELRAALQRKQATPLPPLPQAPLPPPPADRHWLPWLLLGLGIGASALGWLIIQDRPDETPAPPPVAARPMSAPSLAPGARRLQVGRTYNTIEAALNAAQPQDQILIPAGTWQTALRVGVAVTLVGEPGTVLTAKSGTALTVQANVRVVDLEVRGGGAGNRYAVRIDRGQALFEGATVRGAGGSTVGVTGDSEAIFVRSRVIGGAASGILALNAARVSLIDTEITQAGLSGVELAGKSTASIRASQLHANQGAGVLVRDDAQLTCIGSAIFANGNAGVVTKARGAAEITGSRIYKNQAAGLYVHGLGAVRIEKNRVFANRYAGIEVKDGARPTIRANLIRDGLAGGLLIHADARPEVRGNHIIGHALGVEIADRADPLLQDNDIECGANGIGVQVHQAGRGRLINNRVLGCTRVGVQIDAAAPTLEGGGIRNSGVGVRITNGARPRIVKAEISAATTAGMVVVNSAPTVTQSVVDGGPIGIRLRGGGVFRGNTLRNQPKPWQLEAADAAIRQDNRIEGN